MQTKSASAFWETSFVVYQFLWPPQPNIKHNKLSQPIFLACLLCFEAVCRWLCSSSMPETLYVDLAGLKLVAFLLLLPHNAGIKGICHCIQTILSCASPNTMLVVL